ncbi:MAG: hypothetical protein JW908_00500 [Anaerolineales bacterium]|nr:hypothetical protein [Anaerolineales bacterium]
MFGFPEFSVIWAALGGKLIVLGLLTMIDLVMGVILALVYKEFSWEYLGNYLKTDGLPIFAWAVVGFINFIPAEYIPTSITMVIESTVYVTVLGVIFGSIMGHLARIGVIKAGTFGFGKKK